MATITHNDRPVDVKIKGGKLVFTRNGRAKSIPLEQILTNMTEGRPDEVSPCDWVDLGTLERRIMVHAEEGFYPHAKGVMFKIVRELRNERREDRDLPPVVWNKK